MKNSMLFLPKQPTLKIMLKKIICYLAAAVFVISCKSGDRRADLSVPDSLLNQGPAMAEDVMQDIVQNILPCRNGMLDKRAGVEYSNRYLSSTARVDDLTASFQRLQSGYLRWPIWAI
jgi:hypothetical protein